MPGQPDSTPVEDSFWTKSWKFGYFPRTRTRVTPVISPNHGENEGKSITTAIQNEQHINTLRSQQATSRLLSYSNNQLPQTRKGNPSDNDWEEGAAFIIVMGILAGSVACLVLGLRNQESANFGLYMGLHCLSLFVGVIALVGAEAKYRETPRINTRVYQG